MRKMHRTALYQLVDRALDGQLDARLRRWVKVGASKRMAARLLAEELGGIQISPETVRRWMLETGLADGGTEAA